MKRKAVKKSASRQKTKIRTKTTKHSHSSLFYISIGLVILAALLLANLILKASTRVHVLGDATGPLIADGDQADSAGNQLDTNQSGIAQQAPSTQPTSGDTQTISNTQSPSEVLVDCVGPDGKHFTATFHDCQSINSKTNNFQYTPLSNKSDGSNTDNPTGAAGEPVVPTHEATNKSVETPGGSLTVQTEGNKGQLNLETAGTHIEIKKQDNGSISITAHKPDGTEVQLQANSLEKINQALQDKNVEVNTSANGFAIKSDGVQAETNFPLSIDPTTKSLSVTTPNGTKDVTTLPNQAVQNALQQGNLTNVTSTGNQTTPNANSGTNNLSLTEINNEPVYAVQGVSSKKLLGLFPVAFRKTVYISAQDGQVVQTQQSFLNQLLQYLAF